MSILRHVVGGLIVTACIGGALAQDAAQLPGVPASSRPVHAVGQFLDVAPGVELAKPPARAALPGSEKLVPGRPWIALEVSWEATEPAAGRYDFAALEGLLGAVERAGARAVVSLAGGHSRYGHWGATGFEAPAGSEPAAALVLYRHAWADYLRHLARAVAHRTDWYELSGVLPRPGAPDDARLAAFEIKSALVTLRSEDQTAGCALRVAPGAELDLLERAFAGAGDLAPYVDAVALDTPAGADLAPAADALRAALLGPDPGASVWIETTLPADVDPGEDALAHALEALDGRADLVLVRAGAARFAATQSALAGLAQVLGPALGRAPRNGAGIAPAADATPCRWTYFFDDENFREVVAVWSDGVPAAGATTALELETTLRRGFQAFDPSGRGVGVARTTPARAGTMRLDVSLYRRPVLIVIERDRTSPGSGAATEESGARGRHQVTAEEIIAAHQVWKSFQTDRLVSASRDGRIAFRLRYGGVTGSFDIALDADYLWDRTHGAEWVIRDTYLGGVKLRWDKFPELPFIGREQVVALPLELNFDKRYAYELVGTDTVEGRACWELRFRPLEESVSLYRGRAWIDQRTAALVRVTMVQTTLKPPMTSDEETQTFAPFDGPDGTAYWLLARIEGQQLYSVVGGNLVVLRTVTFGPPAINEAGFDAKRETAYASSRQMLRETPQGLKWLDRTPDGGRKVLEKGKTKQLFAVAGLLRAENTDGVVPLGGVNYTDIDAFGKGALFNVFFAGALANVTLSKAGMFGTRLDLGVNLNAVGFASSEKEYRQAQEIEAQRVARRTQNLLLTAGYPLGQFVNVRLTLNTQYNNFQRDETTRDFVVPSDHVETTTAAAVTYDRAGWGLFVRGGASRRSKWEAWGPQDALVTGDELARTKAWRWYGAGVSRSFSLPLFQKIDVSAVWQSGKDLDRFSAFTFGAIGGTRVRGFGGSGIRFDRGFVGSVGYGFNLGDVIRLDAGVDYGRVHDASLAEGMSSHTGVGLAANFVGPWRTLVRLDLGYALRSDLEQAEKGKEIYVVVLRLF